MSDTSNNTQKVRPNIQPIGRVIDTTPEGTVIVQLDMSTVEARLLFDGFLRGGVDESNRILSILKGENDV